MSYLNFRVQQCTSRQTNPVLSLYQTLTNPQKTILPLKTRKRRRAFFGVFPVKLRNPALLTPVKKEIKVIRWLILDMGLTKEYVVTEISASPDGSPHVFISLRGPDEVRGPQSPPFTNVASFHSMDDMFKNLGRVLSKQMMGSFTTVIKLGLNEYEALDIKVGDRISIDINKIPVGIP